jgi:malonate decarboxylase gamma subunit
MGLPAMARITKVPEERLTELAKSNPVFAPGPENYRRMGGVADIWNGDLAQQLQQALAAASAEDRRAALGQQRGGRNWSQRVVTAIVDGADVQPL